jgi:hypothetical protein
MPDDDLLIETVRDGLADRIADLEIPTGMGQRGRRVARRRLARRASVVAVPIAAAAVVAVLATGRGHVQRAVGLPEVVRDVSAQVAQISRSGGVLETISTSADPRIPRMIEWAYTDLRNGITYDVMRYTNRRGKLTYEYWNRARQRSDGRIENAALEILPNSRTWTIERGVTHTPAASPGIQSTARQIALALAHDKVSLQGRGTVHGRTVLKLQLHYHIKGGRYELYVDAHTYRPIEQVVRTTSRGRTVTSRIYLRAATPANIAQASRRPTIPSGFKRFTATSGPARYPSYKHKNKK